MVLFTSSDSKQEGTAQLELVSQADLPPLADPPTTGEKLGLFLLRLVESTSLTPTDIAKLRTNTKYYNQLLTINKIAAELKEHLDTPSATYQNDADNFARMSAISTLGKSKELREFLGSEGRFKDKITIAAILDPARAIAWRYYCTLYPERLGVGFVVWEGVKGSGGKVRWTDLRTGEKPYACWEK